MFVPTAGRFTGRAAITREYIRSFHIFCQRTVIADCDKTDVLKTYKRDMHSRILYKKLAPMHMTNQDFFITFSAPRSKFRTVQVLKNEKSNFMTFQDFSGPVGTLPALAVGGTA